MWHAGDLLLGAVDGRLHAGRQLLDLLGQAILLGRAVARGCLVLGLVLDASVRVESADGAVALLEDLPALLDERLDGVDELLLVSVVFLLGFLGVDGLACC